MASEQSRSITMRKWIEIFFLAFILLQPFLDLAAYIGSPLSNIIRVLAMGIGFIYLVLHPNPKVKWVTTVYVLVLGIFMLVNLGNNYMLNDSFSTMKELTYNIKSAYVIEMLLVYSMVFLSVRNRINWESVVQRFMFINLTIVGIVMALATMTGTGNRSYGFLAKEGHSGWFFSGNEIGAVMALGFGIMILYMMNTPSFRKKLLLFPSVILVAWSMQMIGTKVGLGAVLIILAVGVALSLFELIRRKNWSNLFLTAVVLILSVIYIPFSPIANNLNLVLDSGESESEQPPESQKENGTVDDNDESGNDLMFLSGRSDFLNYTFDQYKQAPLSQQLLGMGPGVSYKGNPKLIEMDYFDWFFGYGVIGSILLFAPFVYVVALIIKRLVEYRFKQINPSFIMVGVGVGLGLGIALFAGHIFMNPASGIYFSVLLSYLYILAVHGAGYTNKH